jgi:hypothetical protein
MKSISYKKKYNYLLIAIPLCALIIYTLAVKKTIILMNGVSDMQQKIELAKDAPQRSEELKAEIDNMDQWIGQKNDKNKPHSLLEIVTDYCKTTGSILREFPEEIETVKGNYIVRTNRLIIEGDFSQLLSLVYTLEQKVNIGKVSSVNYSSRKEPRTKQMTLTATIYLQNITKQ